MNRLFALLMTLYLCNVNYAQTLKADFSAKECTKVLYKQGFDSETDLTGWTPSVTNRDNTWFLGNSRITTVPNFKAINPASIYSLIIRYDDSSYQNESLASPSMRIEPQSSCSFYAAFDGVFSMYAPFTVEVLDISTDQQEVLFNSFLWSQDSGHERPKWLPFTFSLAKYAGKDVKFIFKYEGRGGDDVAVDDFCIIQEDVTGNSRAEITEGAQVHFENRSVYSSGASFEWVFEGGIPAASTDENPVVTYGVSGTYPVKLTVRDASGSDECLKESFVSVTTVAPIAAIGFPAGYLSPFRGIFVPTGVDLHFTDQSANRPTAWRWELPGSSSPIAEQASPVVSYANEGVYGVSLTVSNPVGTDFMVLQDYVQAGGEQNIWNIEVDEVRGLAALPLSSFFGYYGGSNWLGMQAFAEHFDKPLLKGTISEVSIFFDVATTITPDTLITVSIAKAENGFPGEKLASAGVRAKDLAYDPLDWLATVFKFEHPVEIDDEFFVVVEGIPNNTTDAGADDIAIAVSPRRQDGGKTTAYHYLEVWDAQNRPTGELEWKKSEDEFISLAIAPLFAYKKNGSPIAIDKVSLADSAPLAWASNNKLYITSELKIAGVSVYAAEGQLVYTSTGNALPIDVSSWGNGVYIAVIQTDTGTVAEKIQVAK